MPRPDDENSLKINALKEESNRLQKEFLDLINNLKKLSNPRHKELVEKSKDLYKHIHGVVASEQNHLEENDWKIINELLEVSHATLQQVISPNASNAEAGNLTENLSRIQTLGQKMEARNRPVYKQILLGLEAFALGVLHVIGMTLTAGIIGAVVFGGAGGFVTGAMALMADIMYVGNTDMHVKRSEGAVNRFKEELSEMMPTSRAQKIQADQSDSNMQQDSEDPEENERTGLLPRR